MNKKIISILLFFLFFVTPAFSAEGTGQPNAEIGDAVFRPLLFPGGGLIGHAAIYFYSGSLMDWGVTLDNTPEAQEILGGNQ